MQLNELLLVTQWSITIYLQIVLKDMVSFFCDIIVQSQVFVLCCEFLLRALPPETLMTSRKSLTQKRLCNTQTCTHIHKNTNTYTQAHMACGGILPPDLPCNVCEHSTHDWCFFSPLLPVVKCRRAGQVHGTVSVTVCVWGGRFKSALCVVRSSQEKMNIDKPWQ